MLRVPQVPPQIDYQQALAAQLALRDQVVAGADGGLMLLTHPAVVTLGRHANEANIRNLARLTDRQCAVERVNRGGDVTWHGPGQLVGYPIVHLGRLKLGSYAFVCALARVLQDVVAQWGIEARFDNEAPGLWVGRDKLVAIGLHVHRQVTTHGFSLNVDCDLAWYDLIVPCGLSPTERGVTSLSRLLGSDAPDMAEVSAAVAEGFAKRFGVNIIDPAASKTGQEVAE